MWWNIGIHSDQAGISIHVDDVSDLVKNININKPSGISFINSKVLKDAFSFIVPQLQYLFQSSFDKGIFPESWAKAKITPLPKPGDASQVSNLRPISILPIIGKMQEKIAHTYLYRYVESRKLLHDCQYGYRNNTSTGEAVFDYVSDLFRSRDI